MSIAYAVNPNCFLKNILGDCVVVLKPYVSLAETFGGSPTFAALQGKTLHFEGDQRPFKRWLAFRASQSRHAALSQGRINPSDVPEIPGSAWSRDTY